MDELVERYYVEVFALAARLDTDPSQAVSLTQRAFRKARILSGSSEAGALLRRLLLLEFATVC